jgi:HAD superfamily hydrolase (TIGR01549 family)
MGHKQAKGVLFDVGDTLLHQHDFHLATGLKRIVEIAANSSEIDADAFKVAGRTLFLQIRDWQRDILDCGPNHMELRFQSFLRLLIERFGIDVRLALPKIELEFWKAASPMLPEPGAHAVFECLYARGIPAGILSNTVFSGDTIEWELARHGLTDHLSFVMASADYGIRKPHPDLFLTKVQKLGLPPEEVWYVGNSFKADIAGASEAGLVPVWYTRRVADDGKHDGLRVKDWESFVELLEDLW